MLLVSGSTFKGCRSRQPSPQNQAAAAASAPADDAANDAGAAFGAIDANGDGVISRQELREALDRGEVLALYTLARGAKKYLVKHASEAEIRSRTRTVTGWKCGNF